MRSSTGSTVSARIEQDVNTWYCGLSQTEQQPCFKAPHQEGKHEFNLELTDTSNSLDAGDWTFVSAQARRRNLPPPLAVTVRNTHNALQLENDEHLSNGQGPGKDNDSKLIWPPALEPVPPEKECKVLVTSDYLLRGIEASHLPSVMEAHTIKSKRC